MTKTVFRVITKSTRKSKDVPFYEASQPMEAIRAYYKSQNKVLDYYAEISGDELTRIFLIDFVDEESKILFRQENIVDNEMQLFYAHNSDKDIVTEITEELTETTDYDN